ncbi:hypothetical protein SUGI_1005220 [Cryptomeria japonica]|nr:hypothetical protein SUGI_1005220 [Cryptomeria japonica]
MTLLLLVLIFTDGCRCVESYSQFSKRENTQKPEAWRKNKGMKYLFPDTRLHDLTLQSVTPPLLPQCRRHQALTHYNSILQFQLLTSSRRGAEARSEKIVGGYKHTLFLHGRLRNCFCTCFDTTSGC